MIEHEGDDGGSGLLCVNYRGLFEVYRKRKNNN